MNNYNKDMGKNLLTGVVLGLASAGAILTIANMQEGKISNTGIILGAITGPSIVIGLKKLL